MRVSGNYGANITNPYQEDKTQLLTSMDNIKKAIAKKDFNSAKDILNQTEKLFDKKPSKRQSDLQTTLKHDLENLSNAITKKDSAASTDSIGKIQNDIKSNKNIILKTKDMTEILSTIRQNSLLSLYA